MQPTPPSRKPTSRRRKLEGLFWLLFLLAACFSALKLVTYPLINFYHEGHCTITANLTNHLPGVGGNNGHPASIRPDYGFTLHTAEGETIQTSGFEWFTSPLGEYYDETGFTIPNYHVGQTYPCWYNPLAHSQAVLTREVDWGALFFRSGNGFYLWIGRALLVGAFIFMIRFSLVLLSPLTKALTPNYWRRKDRALQSLNNPSQQGPSTATESNQIPPEVYPLAAAHHVGVPVEEYVVRPQRANYGCLLAIIFPITAFLVFMLLALLLFALLASTHVVLDPTPGWIAPILLFLLIFSLVIGVVLPVLIMGPAIAKRQQADILYRFARAELLYTCTQGILWIKGGKVTGAYPWHIIQGANTEHNVQGVARTSWVYFTDGTRREVSIDAVPMIQRGLIHYR